MFLKRLVITPGAHTRPQAELARDLRARIADLPGSRQITSVVGFVYERSGIKQRHFEIDLEEIERHDNWYGLVNQATFALGARALEQLFSEEISPADCDGLVVVASSYAGFPSLGRRLQARFGLPASAPCFDLTGLGCAGPTHGLYLAHTLLEQGACRDVCVLCVDAMGTHGQSRKHREVPVMSQLVAHCLASDGAAALVLGKDPGARPLLGYEACSLSSRLWPDSLDLNDFTASEDGQPYISVGSGIRTRLLEECAVAFTPEVLASPLYLHPGGAALMKIIADRFPELRETAALSLSVLAEHGNVGSPSLLWVLDQALARGLPVGPQVHLFALGPGIVSSMLRLEGALAGGPGERPAGGAEGR